MAGKKRRTADEGSANSNVEGGPGILVARLRKNTTQEIVISINSFEGHDYVDIRTFFGSRGGETKPSAKGVTIPVALYPEFRRLMEQLDDIMDDKGWA